MTGWVLGIDGCPGGWIGALVSPAGDVEWHRFGDAGAIIAVDASATGIDIPIGLPRDGPRDCDVAARRRLRPYGSRVFPAPLRAVLAADTYREACEISRRRHVAGKAPSRQTWNLVGKIREVDAVMRPELQSRVIEVHPEVSFLALSGAGPLASKKSARGREQRRAGLRGFVPGFTLPRGVRPDDALDALAVAWSARRWLAGEAEVLPSADAPRDGRGLRMEIVC